MEYYVDAAARATGNGTKERPFKTIQEAANIAKAGDTVNVLPGVYREYVNPIHAGREDARITYRSTVPRKAVITGAEEVKSWERYGENVWMARIPNSVFGSENPYTTLIIGDWYIADLLHIPAKCI